jgi:hypothetical protein
MIDVLYKHYKFSLFVCISKMKEKRVTTTTKVCLSLFCPLQNDTSFIIYLLITIEVTMLRKIYLCFAKIYLLCNGVFLAMF